MKVCILGIDGYLGWSLALYLKNRGHNVWGVDNGYRRSIVNRVGSDSLIPILTMEARRKLLADFYKGNIATSYADLKQMFTNHKPDAIVHFAEQPSAPYSMKSVRTCVETQVNNIVGTLNVLWAMKETCPEAHLLKLGTMGEYGTPNMPIPEGYFEIEYRNCKDRLPFPKQAGSWYHQTKVTDTNHIAMACNQWGLRATDIMQGVVYGAHIDDAENEPVWWTRFDYDECFGTVINRFCVQAALGMPCTVYGKGGQTRGFININDSMRCFELSMLNPPKAGEHRVFNQFGDLFSIEELGRLVCECAHKHFGLIKAEYGSVENPRIEAEEHFYLPECVQLRNLGFRPRNFNDELVKLLGACVGFAKHAKPEAIAPKTKWR